MESGCPNLLRKVVNSAKRIRAYVQKDEGDVCCLSFIYFVPQLLVIEKLHSIEIFKCQKDLCFVYCKKLLIACRLVVLVLSWAVVIEQM